MSYRCQVCEAVVKEKTPVLKHIIYREGHQGRQVVREIPCCFACHSLLKAGMPMEQARKIALRGKPPAIVAPPPPVVLARPKAPKYHPTFFGGQVPVLYKDVKKK